MARLERSVGIRLDDQLYQKLDELCRLTGRNKSELLALFIRSARVAHMGNGRPVVTGYVPGKEDRE